MLFIDTYGKHWEAIYFCHSLLDSSLSHLMTDSFFWFEVSELVKLVDFLGGSDSKESTCNAWDLGLIPGSGRSAGEANSNSFQYSCLKNFMDKGAL